MRVTIANIALNIIISQVLGGGGNSFNGWKIPVKCEQVKWYLYCNS